MSTKRATPRTAHECLPGHNDYAKPAPLKEITSLHIAGRRWFQKTYGNTYHSVTVFVNGATLNSGRHYGYGDQYLDTAGELLKAAGYDLRFSAQDVARGSCHLGTLHLREVLHGTYDVADVARERDL